MTTDIYLISHVTITCDISQPVQCLYLSILKSFQHLNIFSIKFDLCNYEHDDIK